MGKARETLGSPKLQTAGIPKDCAGDATEEIRNLLVYLKLAVEAILAQLAAKHKPFYTVEELADLFGRSPYTVRRWIGDGRIKAIRLDGCGPRGRLLVARDQLEILVGEGMGAALPDAVVG